MIKNDKIRSESWFRNNDKLRSDSWLRMTK